MEILLTDSVAGKNSFTVEESLQLSDIVPGMKAEVIAKFQVGQQEDTVYHLDGSFKAAVVSSCDRCLSTVEFEVGQDFHYQLKVGEEPQTATDYNCTEEDCEVVYLSLPAIESSDILREQLLLALPTSCLCGVTCKGLCDRCGINLNKKQCKCRETNEDSPFALLKKIQIN